MESVSCQKQKMFQSTNSIKFRRRSLSSQVFHPISRLTPGVKKFLLKAPVNTIHHRMGDFFATEVMLGGVFQTQTVTAMYEEETESEVQTDMEASYKFIAYSADASFSAGGSSTSKSEEHSYKSRVKALGGDTSIWLKLNGDNRQEVQSEWVQSVHNGNEFPVSFQVVPLWHLLDDVEMDIAKAAELKAYMLKRWQEAKVPHYPGIPIKAKTVQTTAAPSGQVFWEQQKVNENRCVQCYLYLATNTVEVPWGLHSKDPLTDCARSALLDPRCSDIISVKTDTRSKPCLCQKKNEKSEWKFAWGGERVYRIFVQNTSTPVVVRK